VRSLLKNFAVIELIRGNTSNVKLSYMRVHPENLGVS